MRSGKSGWPRCCGVERIVRPASDGVSRIREPLTECYDSLQNAFIPSFPEWWNWDLTEVDLRAMLEKATAFEHNVVEGRFMIHARHLQHPWIVIVEPDADAKLLVEPVYEVAE